MKSATSLSAQNQKNQPAQNSAVKYKNTTMNTIQNLKLASSNLKNEIEKMLSSKKNENSIKVAKIQLNRTNDTSEVVVENSMEHKNQNGVKQMNNSQEGYYYSNHRKGQQNPRPTSSSLQKNQNKMEGKNLSAKDIFLTPKAKSTFTETKDKHLSQTTGKKEEEPISKFIDPQPKTSLFSKLKAHKENQVEPPTEEKKRQEPPQIENKEPVLVKKLSSNKGRAATEDKATDSQSPQTRIMHDSPLNKQLIIDPDLGEIVINPLNLNKLLGGTESSELKLSTSPRLIENLPSVRLKSVHEERESIDIGQMIRSGPLQQFSKKKSFKNEDLVDPTNQFLTRMLDMKLLRGESTSSMGVEVNADDVEKCLLDIKPDYELYKRNSVEKDYFLKIHDRSGFDDSDAGSVEKFNKGELDSGRIMKSEDQSEGTERDDEKKEQIETETRKKQYEIVIKDPKITEVNEKTIESTEDLGINKNDQDFSKKKEFPEPEEDQINLYSRLKAPEIKKEWIYAIKKEADKTPEKLQEKEESGNKIPEKMQEIENKIPEEKKNEKLFSKISEKKDSSKNFEKKEQKKDQKTIPEIKPDLTKKEQGKMGFGKKDQDNGITKKDLKKNKEVMSAQNLWRKGPNEENRQKSAGKSFEKNQNLDEKKNEKPKETKNEPPKKHQIKESEEKKEVINLREKARNIGSNQKEKELLPKKNEISEKKIGYKNKEEKSLEGFAGKKTEIMKEILTLSQEIETLSKEKEHTEKKKKDQAESSTKVIKTIKEFSERNAKIFEKKDQKIQEGKDKTQKKAINMSSSQPKIKVKSEKIPSFKDIKLDKPDKISGIIKEFTEVVSFHSANIINEKGKSPASLAKEKQPITKKPDDKIKELYANFQKIRENKNSTPKNKKFESAKKSNKNPRNQAKSAEKEINQEIQDILEIFKSASKVLNSQNLEDNKKPITKFGNNFEKKKK